MLLLSLLAATAMGHMTTQNLCGTWDNMLNAYGDCTVNFCDGEAFARTQYNFRVNLEGENHPTLYDSVTTIHNERFCASATASVDEDGVTTVSKNEEDSVVMRIKQHGGYVLQSEELAPYAEKKPMEIEGQATVVFYPTGYVVTLAEGANPMYSWPDGTCQTAVEYLNEFCPCGGTWGEGERTLDTLMECDGLNCPAFFKQKAHSHTTVHEYNERNMLVMTAPSTDFSSHRHGNELGWALEQTSIAGCVRPSTHVFDGKDLEENFDIDREQSEEEKEEKPTCEDVNDSCKQWAKAGYCALDSMYHKYTVLHCPASCQLTDKQSTEDCAYWNGLGYCAEDSDYSEFMNVECMATCHPQGGCALKWNKPGGKYFHPPPPPPKNGGGGGGGSYTSDDDGYSSNDDGYGTSNEDGGYTEPTTYDDNPYGSNPLAAGTEDDKNALPNSERNLFYITGAVVSATLVSSAFYYFCLRKKPELAADPSDYVSIVDEQT